jgi:antitoxin (DNA-binding transcriptional repressor) of toxin-antitoxin stability system
MCKPWAVGLPAAQVFPGLVAVEIARDGVPVARLVKVDRPQTPGERFWR